MVYQRWVGAKMAVRIGRYFEFSHVRLHERYIGEMWDSMEREFAIFFGSVLLFVKSTQWVQYASCLQCYI